MSDYFSTPPVPIASEEAAAYQAAWSVDGTFSGPSISYAIPGDYYVTLSSVSVEIITSAAVASRALTLVFAYQDGTDIVTVPAPASQPGATTFLYSWTTGVTSGFFNGVDSMTAPLPRIVLIPGWSIFLHLSNIQVGDTATPPQFVGTRIPTAATPTGYVPAATPLLASPVVV